MKETGVTRSLDSLGRVVIPIEIRRRFGIKEDELLEFYVEDDKIILKKFVNSCVFCGSRDSISTFKDSYVCADCMRELKGE